MFFSITKKKTITMEINKTGLTLVEMIVLIIILCILVSICYFKFLLFSP